MSVNWEKDNFSARVEAPRLSDLVNMLSIKHGDTHTLRLIGPAQRKAVHWFEINKKDGGKTRIPKICLAYDDENGEFNGECPYCDLGNRPRITVDTNVIDRDLQDNAPRKIRPPEGKEAKLRENFGEEAYFKESRETRSWTPVLFASFSPSVANKIKDLVTLNKRKTKNGVKVFNPEHPRFGFDIIIKYDKTRAPAEQYSVLRGENTELSEEELDYLRWKLGLETPMELADAKKDAKQLQKVLSDGDSDDDDRPAKKKRRDIDEDDWDDVKSKKTNRSRDLDEDEDDDRPAKKKRRSRAVEDDDDEDDAPKSAKRSKRNRDDDDEDEAPKRRSRKVADEDEDDDDWD